MRLLSVNQDAKTVKGLKKGYLTGILYLAPNRLLCPACSAGCRKACLVSAGHGRMNSVQQSRARKTKLWLHKREAFKRFLIADIQDLIFKAQFQKLKPCVRINGTSDIDVQTELADVLEMFNNVQFYDYTKVWNREATAKNYYLCYSRSEKTTDEQIQQMLLQDKNVAVVFNNVPEMWHGFTVIQGDESDLRFLDSKGAIVGLKAKGKAKKDTTGFVVKGE